MGNIFSEHKRAELPFDAVKILTDRDGLKEVAGEILSFIIRQSLKNDILKSGKPFG